MTNYHVLEGAVTATAALTDGRQQEIEGVLYSDAVRDYAVIKVSGEGFTPLTVGDSSAVKGGEKIYTLGNPRGMTNTISDGLVSNPRSDYLNMIQITAPISHGSSGGALINAYGAVVGVTTGAIENAQNLNLAVPINAVLREGGIAQYIAAYGVTPLRDFALANGYLPGGGRSSAFAALRNFVILNANQYLSDGSPAWYYSDGSDGFMLVYDLEDGELMMMLYRPVWNGHYTSFLVVDPTDAAVFTNCGFYADDSAEVTASGSAWLHPGSFYSSAPYSFGEFSGPVNLKRSMEIEAMRIYNKTLQTAAYILSHLVPAPGSYTMADLGFTWFK